MLNSMDIVWTVKIKKLYRKSSKWTYFPSALLCFYSVFFIIQTTKVRITYIHFFRRYSTFFRLRTTNYRSKTVFRGFLFSIRKSTRTATKREKNLHTKVCLYSFHATSYKTESRAYHCSVCLSVYGFLTGYCFSFRSSYFLSHSIAERVSPFCRFVHITRECVREYVYTECNGVFSFSFCISVYLSNCCDGCVYMWVSVCETANNLW